MDNEELNSLILENKMLKKENESLKEENDKMKKLMENYNNSRKSYYEKNKELVNQKAKDRMKKLSQEDPERLKEINRKAYLKRKEKLEKEEKS